MNAEAAFHLANIVRGLPPPLAPVARARLKAFMLRHRVRLSERRFPRWFMPEYRELKPRYPGGLDDIGTIVLDHVHTWTRDGRQVLMTCQPYDVQSDEHGPIRKAFASLGFMAEIDPGASWWYPGESTLIVVSPAERRSPSPQETRTASGPARGTPSDSTSPRGAA